MHSLPRFINSTLTGAKVSYEFRSDTLQSLFGPKKKPFIHGGGDADLCRVNTLAVLHASSRWARSSSRVNPRGADITPTRIKNKIRGLFLITSEHGMKFQMDLLRGTGTCKRLRSPEVPARICRTKPGWWIFPVSINARSFLFAPLATNSSLDPVGMPKTQPKGPFFPPSFIVTWDKINCTS